MSIRGWLYKRLDPEGYALRKEAERQIHERIAVILEHLEKNGDLADIVARVVDTPPEWSQEHQTWVVRDKGLKVQRPIVFTTGRGGKEYEDAFVLERLDEPDSAGVASYSITFDMPEEATDAS